MDQVKVGGLSNKDFLLRELTSVHVFMWSGNVYAMSLEWWEHFRGEGSVRCADACCLLGGWGLKESLVLRFLWREYLRLCTLFSSLLLRDRILIPGCCCNAKAV